MKKKIALFLCGGSGVGKTSSRERILLDAKLTTRYVYINLDDLRAKMPIKDAREEIVRILERTVTEGKSFVWDATCRNTGTIIEHMNYAKKHGYTVVLSMVYASLATTLERIERRTDQPVPKETIKGIYSELKRKAERYMHVESIDQIFLYNNDHTTTLLFSRIHDTISCRHPGMNFYFDIKQFC